MKIDASSPSGRYWVQVFTIDTWNQFLNAGATVTGFRVNRWGFVQRLKPGDWLLCYLSKVSRWVGILEVKSEPYLDDTTRIWKEEAYPCRVDVSVVTSLPPSDAIPIKDVADLSIFNEPSWSVFLMASPTLWKEPDAKAVVNAIQTEVASKR
jgi:predicted RNA-binding protein